MSRETDISAVLAGWPSLNAFQKMRIYDEAFHQCVADHQGKSLEQVKSEGDTILRNTLADALALMSDDEITSIHTKFTEVK